MNKPKSDRSAIGRRALLAGWGATAIAATLPAHAASEPGRLPLTASTTEGPFYFDANRVRSDIAEGLDGVPLQLRFTVVDPVGKALKGLAVDVWHCDAQGRYSPRGETFLRGRQLTADDGAAAFTTIYPGWYPGRTTHVHFKVLNGPRAVLTSQLFLPDALSEFIYTRLPPYKRDRVRTTLNSNDGIALEAGGSVVGSVREDAMRYVAALRVVVDPRGRPVASALPEASEVEAPLEDEERTAWLVPGQLR